MMNIHLNNNDHNNQDDNHHRKNHNKKHHNYYDASFYDGLLLVRVPLDLYLTSVCINVRTYSTLLHV